MTEPTVDHTSSKRRRVSRFSRRGNSTLELSLVLPILMSMAFGLVEFGQFFFIKHCFESAVRDAARVATLATATQAQVTSTLTTTLAQANVTYNSSWLTITDLGPTNSGTVTDVATVPPGDELQFTLSTNYSGLANVVRPLYSMTGVGVKPTVSVSGVCTIIKE